MTFAPACVWSGIAMSMSSTFVHSGLHRRVSQWFFKTEDDIVCER